MLDGIWAYVCGFEQIIRFLKLSCKRNPQNSIYLISSSCVSHILLCFTFFKYNLFFKFIHNAGGAFLQYGTGNQFSTYDQDHDVAINSNCAEIYTGAWWYGACHSANLNGQYMYGQDNQSYAQGVVWSSWRGYYYSLKTTEMKLRPVQ